MSTTVSRLALPRPYPARTDRWTRLPDQLISELTPREHKLIHLLLSYKWFADSVIRPYVDTLARRMNCHVRTVQRALSSLERKQYIVRVARYRDLGEDGRHHGQTSNAYGPGPLLLPLLPPADDRPDAADGQPRRDGVTSTPPKKNYRNYQKGSRQSEGRYTPPRCDFCGAPKGGPHLKGECYTRGLPDYLRRH